MLTAIVFLAGTVLLGCDSGDGEQIQTSATPNEETLAARVDDWSVTREYLQEYIEALTESQKRKYDTHEGRAIMAGQMIEEELFFREAERLDLTQDEWVKGQLKEATRRILIQGYYRKHVTPEAEPDEQEIHDYYEAHEDIYTTLEVCRAQHIFSKNRERLEELKQRIVSGGEKFTTMAHKYSEDRITQADGGDLGFFNPGGYIRGVGFSKTFSDTVFQLEPHKAHGPIKWEKGYSLVYVNEKRPPQLRPYADVRGEIRDILMRDRIENARDEVVQRVLAENDYDVRNYMHEFFMTIQRSPEELWNFAQSAEDPHDRLRSFTEIAEKFPNDDYAPQAMFMVGFVYAEELYDYVTADRTFAKLVERYPDSEYAEMAKWMIENMGKDAPKFEDIEDVNRRMQDDS
jgi:parvulin-like peptidyl-prolyl isomerase